MKIVRFLIVAIIAFSFTSCYVTRTWTGNYRELVKVDKVDTYRYAKGKQAYLFWGMIPLGRTQVATPAHGVCQIRTSWNFFDSLVGTLTGGIITMQTIKVKAPILLKNKENANLNYSFDTEVNIDLMTDISDQMFED